MADAFEDLMNDVEQYNDEFRAYEGGDDCPKTGCSHELTERHHERNPKLGTDPHPDAPEMEAICPVHGIIYNR